MQMHMRYELIGSRAIIEQEVAALDAPAECALRMQYAATNFEQVVSFLRTQFCKLRFVCIGNHQHMPAPEGVKVHKGKTDIIFVNLGCWHLIGKNLAKNAGWPSIDQWINQTNQGGVSPLVGCLEWRHAFTL